MCVVTLHSVLGYTVSAYCNTLFRLKLAIWEHTCWVCVYMYTLCLSLLSCSIESLMCSFLCLCAAWGQFHRNKYCYVINLLLGIRNACLQHTCSLCCFNSEPNVQVQVHVHVHACSAGCVHVACWLCMCAWHVHIHQVHDECLYSSGQLCKFIACYSVNFPYSSGGRALWWLLL